MARRQSDEHGLRPTKALLPYLLLAALAVSFCGRAVFRGRTLLPLDMLLLMVPWKFHSWRFPDFHVTQNEMLDPVQQYYPWRHFAVHSLTSGHLPLWNPFCFSGTPFVANMQSAVFYPPNLLFLFLPLTTGFTVSAILHIFIAGASMFALLRSLGLSTVSSLLGAVAYMFNGSLVAWLEFPAFGQWVMPWLPLAILCVRRCMTTPTAVNAVLASAVLALQFLGGQLQYSAYVLLACAIWIAVARPNRRAFLTAALALCLGFGLAACQLLPSLELGRQSARPDLSYEQALRSAIPLPHLATYFVPLLFGTPAKHDYVGHLAAGRPEQPGMFTETACYIGLLPLLLAFLGATQWRKREGAFFAAASLLALLIALGTPLYAALYYMAPGFKQLAGVSRILYLAAFGLAGLAALGLERLMQRKPAFVQLAAVPIAGVMLVAGNLYVFHDLLQAIRPHVNQQLVAAALFLVASLACAVLVLRSRHFAWLALAVAAADLFYFGSSFNPATDPRMAYFSTAETDYLQRNIGHARMLALGTNAVRDWMPPNTPLVYGLRDIQGSDSLWWGRYARLLKRAQPSAPSPQWRDLGSPLLDLLSVKYIITTQTLSHPDWELAFSDNARIYSHKSELPRACLLDIPAEEAAREAADNEFKRPAPSGSQAATGGKAVIIRDGINSVRIEVRAPRPMFLRLADTAFPGWRAFVDGKRAELLPVDLAFRMVRVPRGRHEVEFRYEPGSFHIGLFLSLLSLGCLAFALARRKQ